MEPGTRDGVRSHVIGIGELVVSDDPQDILVTYSLGSCIGVAVYDPQAGVGGLIHCLLPTSKGASESDSPARFVDKGVVALLRAVYEAGATREDLVVKVAGAGHPLQDCEGFRIGERNHAALRKVLWKNDLLIASERIGGSDPKTLSLHVRDGRTTVRSGGVEEDL